jgi:maleylacetoacetate isomerase
MAQSVILHSYFRSSAAFRVRIALELKSIPYQYNAVHLLENGGEQNRPEYRKMNSMGEVPSFQHGDRVIGQSMAILEYMDVVWPKPRLIPEDPYLAALTRQFCENINSGIHPIQNLKVLQELEKRYAVSQEGKTDWAAYWIRRGFASLEQFLEKTSKTYCIGGEITAADLFLIPQVVNARRYNVDLTPFPNIVRIDEACSKIPAFQRAHPTRQPDTPKEG